MTRLDVARSPGGPREQEKGAAHAMKLGFEKYFVWKARNGYVNLP